MTLHILKSIPLAGAAVVGCALGVWFSASTPVPALVAQATAAARDDRQELDQLIKARYETAKSLLDLEEKRQREGVTTLRQVCDVARWVRDAAIELPDSVQQRLMALTNYVVLTRRLEASVDRAVTQGVLPPTDREWARYIRLDAEIVLLRTELRDKK